MRILVTNDDGIDAKGIEILAGAAKHLSNVLIYRLKLWKRSGT